MSNNYFYDKFISLQQATCHQNEVYDFDDAAFLDAEMRLNIKEEIAKYLKKIVDEGDQYVLKMQIKSAGIIEELRNTTRKVEFAAHLSVDTALKGMEALLKKASDKGISAASCMKGKIEDIRAKNASFVTDLTKAIKDSTDKIERTLQGSLAELRWIISEYKKLLDTPCSGIIPCGKLIVKFGTKFFKAAEDMANEAVKFGKDGYKLSKEAASLVGKVSGKYIKETTGVISETVKCLKKLLGGKFMPYYVDYQF